MKHILFIGLVMFCTSGTYAQQFVMGADVNTAYGDTAYHAGDYDEAIKQYSWALVTKKTDPDLYYKRARAYIKQDIISKAKRDLKRASRIGSYKSDLLLDSLMGRTGGDESREQFEQDLEKYLKSTD